MKTTTRWSEWNLNVTTCRSQLTFDCVQDFFSKAVGNVKKVLLSYGPSGRSRGEATVVFGRPESAAKAQKEFNNVGVDGKPMRVCKLHESRPVHVLTPIRSRLSLAPPHRVHLQRRYQTVWRTYSTSRLIKRTTNALHSKPKPVTKPTPKAAAAKKDGPKPAANGAARGGRAEKKSGRAGKPKAKTADELDAEMADYFGGGEAINTAATNGDGATNGAAPAAAAGEMEDVVS